MKRYLIYIVSLLILSSCTHNPFFDDTIEADASNTITGYVRLENDTHHDGVLVWLDKLNIHAFSDSAGFYKLSIPAKSENVPGGGISGKAIIYYYLANYLLKSNTVVLFDNSFKAGDADLKENGLMEAVELQNLVNITTVSDRASFVHSDSTIIGIKTRITAPMGKTASIQSWLTKEGALASFYFRSLTNSSLFLFKNFNRITSRTVVGALELEGTIHIKPFSINPGSYEVFPYIMVRQDLPEGLLDVLGDEVADFSKNYLNLPIRHKKPTITVLDL